jgi:hypothetical protein
MSQTEEDKKISAIEQTIASSSSKGALIEKIVFAGIPILFSCVGYLMTALSSANNEILTLKNKVSIVVNNDNKAVPQQGVTIDMAQIREDLGKRIDKLERDEAIARGNMSMDRKRQIAEAAMQRQMIRSDLESKINGLREVLVEKMDSGDKEGLKNLVALEKRLALIEYRLEQMDSKKK